MKLVCKKSDLITGINIVMKAVSSKTTMSILECILIDATEGVIKFTANDMELGIETKVEGEIIEAGSIAIDAKIFSEIVRKLPDNDVVIEVNDETKANITCENSKFNILVNSADDFSYLPEIEKKDKITLSQFALKELIRQTIFTVNDADKNKILTGELFEAMGNRDAAVIEAQGLAKSREIQGYNWQQEQQFNVSKAFAENEGFAGNPANMMAQIPLAFSMGDMMKNNMDAAVQAQPVTAAQTGTAAMQPDIAATQSQPAVQPQAQGGNITCVKCGTSLPKDAKFCFQCGEKVVIPQKIFCANCGNEMPPEANFCTKCGTRREK